MTDGVPPLRWLASVLYLAVLLTGLYYAVAGLAPQWSGGALAVFVGALLALLAVERADSVPGRRRAIGLLVTRMVLVGVVAAADAPGFARILFVLIPFFAYFSLGRRFSIGLAVVYLLVAVVRTATVAGWWSDPEIVSDLLMLFAGMVLTVATAAVADEQRRSRLRAERLVTELSAAQRRLADYAGRVAELSAAAERARLARDIHDSVGHHLTAISVQLAKAEAFRDRDPAVADRAVSDAHRAAARALQEVRESVGALSSAPFSLPAALAALADGLDDGGFRVELEITGSEAGHDREGLAALYRVAQEALTNARRHAKASGVRVVVRLTGDATLEVTDDGCGFSPSQVAAAGTGLRGMRERLAALGGTLHIGASPGAGTQIKATIPTALPGPTLSGGDGPFGAARSPAVRNGGPPGVDEGRGDG